MLSARSSLQSGNKSRSSSHGHHNNGVRKVPQRKRYRPREHISSCVKFLLFSFNFLFWLLGLGVAVLGCWILWEKDKIIRDALDFVFDPAILLCGSGIIIFLVTFCGCLGALRENICMLKTFQVFLMLILLTELVCGVLLFMFYYVPDVRQQMGGSLSPDETLKEAIVRYRDDDDLRDTIDSIQREFKCCGISNNDNGYQDWQSNMYFNCSDSNPSVEKCGVPYSCCKMKPNDIINVMCGFGTTNKLKGEVTEKIYTQGCLKGFGNWLERNTIIIGAACLGIILPQIIGICLARNLHEQIEMQKAQWR